MEKNLSRRGFLKGAFLAGASSAAIGLAGCAADDLSDTGSPSEAWWLPPQWEMETDVLVVGYGAAGEAAAITAFDAGAEVLVIDAAPEDELGGNSLVATELILCPHDAEGFAAYQTALNADYVVDQEHIKVLAEELSKNKEWLESFGMDIQDSTMCSPEYPSVEGSESVSTYLVEGKAGAGLLWYQLNDEVELRGIEVRPSTRAVELVQNPQTKEILGAKVLVDEKDERFVKARKGVVLSCGGFEGNTEMLNTYFNIGYVGLMPSGTPYNRGDGIKMALGVGANLWHMNSFAMDYLGVNILPDVNTAYYINFTLPGVADTKDWIYVGPQGARFMYEEKDGLTRHGLVEYGGVYSMEQVPSPAHIIFGQDSYNALSFGPVGGGFTQFHPQYDESKSNDEYLAEGIIATADTVEGLAEQIGVDPEALSATIHAYNENAAKGVDPEYGRGEAIYGDLGYVLGDEETTSELKVVSDPFDLVPIQAPYYAMRLTRNVINTQGGPKRNKNVEIVDVNDTPIPRLYGAGECGSPYSYMYNGGGNIGDCLASGRLAGANVAALDSWE